MAYGWLTSCFDSAEVIAEVIDANGTMLLSYCVNKGRRIRDDFSSQNTLLGIFAPKNGMLDYHIITVHCNIIEA